MCGKGPCWHRREEAPNADPHNPQTDTTKPKRSKDFILMGLFDHKSLLVPKVGKVGMSRPILALAQHIPELGRNLQHLLSLFLELVTALD